MRNVKIKTEKSSMVGGILFHIRRDSIVLNMIFTSRMFGKNKIKTV